MTISTAAPAQTGPAVTSAQVATAGFHACPTDPHCRYCQGADPPDWSFVDAAYCISLIERDDRAAAAAAEFHKVGLCRGLVFYRPVRHPTQVIEGIWESHRAVAVEALAQGAGSALILEDDASFAPWVGHRTLRAVAKAMATLPAGWSIFFLGHWPLRARFVRHDVLRTTSGCAHAYVASQSLLGWLAATPFTKHDRNREQVVGGGIDAFYARMPGAFAYFPMLATQAVRGSDHMAEKKRKRRITKLRHLVTRTSLGEILLSRLMRPNELMMAGVAVVMGSLEWIAHRLGGKAG